MEEVRNRQSSSRDASLSGTGWSHTEVVPGPGESRRRGRFIVRRGRAVGSTMGKSIT